MKKDIDFHQVEGVSIAIAREVNDLGQEEWNVYFINSNEFYLENVLISTKGYGHLNGDEVKTSVLRHMFDQMAPKSALQVEPIDPALFQITNEFWVSYYIGSTIYDKRFVFVPGSVIEENLSAISILEKEGVLHS
ncbi:hypothetical protein ACD591_13955 [Rufibacter glacialis]|uniref:Uncharacterized protein n=1 Tax=Rufibacter glacialis TaxID=1259555 RepID=A0A5M8Q7F8_9BACT|nr:hypothetical protein [Rufibacter glacialis]KAA6431048.1 hypothetical protein FOE74_18270 [Rufibacter glacialis]GGK83563.1 hypothetical protein GCM10011405_34330 [Rufibacter glacialis]